MEGRNKKRYVKANWFFIIGVIIVIVGVLLVMRYHEKQVDLQKVTSEGSKSWHQMNLEGTKDFDDLYWSV